MDPLKLFVKYTNGMHIIIPNKANLFENLVAYFSDIKTEKLRINKDKILKNNSDDIPIKFILYP